MGDERRKFKRYVFGDDESFTCSFHWNGEQVNEQMIVRLSAGGMFIAVPDVSQFKRHDPISDIRFTLKTYEIMIPKGRIAHTYPLGEITGCGIEFVDLVEQQVDSLENLLSVTVREAREGKGKPTP
ncbi:MAG: PilZ domain-containing protein [Acidobacteria bacterium]|nr:PilZ domain-containing protein [Acidobacteriota bacterium]